MEIKQHIAISESGLIFNPVTGDSFTVNPIGLDILRFLKEKKNFQEIQEYILSKYDTDTDIFRRDFQDFVNCLRIYDLIQDVWSPGGAFVIFYDPTLYRWKFYTRFCEFHNRFLVVVN